MILLFCNGGGRSSSSVHSVLDGVVVEDGGQKEEAGHCQFSCSTQK